MAEKEQENILTEEQIGQMSFEQLVKSLNGIVEQIEAGQIPLEQSLSRYEQGMAMISRCRKIIQEAEKRIQNVSEEISETD